MVPLIRVRKASRKSHWGSIAIRRGWTPLFLRIVRLLRCFKPWEGEGGPQALKHAGRCEPGDLPANEGNRARPGKDFPAACTEVVMAVSNTSSIALSANDRLVAGVFALLLGAFLVFGAGLANSAVLHDTAHDTRHSYGFPCH